MRRTLVKEILLSGELTLLLENKLSFRCFQMLALRVSNALGTWRWWNLYRRRGGVVVLWIADRHQPLCDCFTIVVFLL